jgi:hypothetical protein
MAVLGVLGDSARIVADGYFCRERAQQVPAGLWVRWPLFACNDTLDR